MDGPGAKGPQSGDCVRVAVNIRPLITPELLDGCNDCITVVPGEPQVQIGSHVFTYDHVYGSSGSPLSAIYDESVAPLVDSLFSGYNATVLAYGQTGSGKTYTMGTNYSGDASASGIIPKVMEHIFKKVEATKDNTEFLIRVSFIEIFKEEVFDLLDSSTTCRNEGTASAKSHLPARVPIQIRETTNGGITLAGVNEAEVCSKEEMASFLSRGSLARATACTNMNSQSSRSHAIFTISMEMKKTNSSSESGKTADDEGEDILSAKLHLVDLAGSERAKRTGADGLRLKEGIHINRGLLALGNVISALGDEKKRKEGGHVPYRDSKLTRLLQDSLGGNSKTVMIACVSPADTNAEETLNTLKYANRARNIQNKAVVNRDPVAAQMQKMRSQLEQLQAELLHYQGCGTPIEGLQIMQHKIALLESRNAELCRELNSRQIACESLEKRAVDAQLEKDMLILQLESLQHGKLLDENDTCDKAKESNLLKGYISKIQDLELKLLQSQRLANPQQLTFGDGLDVEDISLNPDADLLSTTGDIVSCSEVDTEDNEKELEYSTLQIKFGEELQELNKQLKLKEEEMKQFSSHDASTLKQHYEKKLCDLEQDKKALQKEIEHLRHLVANISSVSDDGAQKLKQEYLKKLTCLEAQVAELKKKQEANSQILRQKQKSDDAAKRLQEEILRIKTQKVQLQQKIKQESEQFRAWKASREKEVLQLKKEGRRNEYEMHKLAALNQRQKMVLQRKTEEAALATKRLKELLDAKRNPKDSSGNGNMNAAGLQALMQAIEHELEVTVRVHEVRSEYERQCEARAAMANEIARLRDEHALLKQSRLCDSPHAMSPSARNSRIFALENMLKTSSSTLVAMASQLSEAEERERVFSGRGRWNQIRSLPEAKNLLNFLFNLASSSRCQLRDKEAGLRETDSVIRELKQKVFTLSTLVRQLETQNSKLETQIQAQRAPRKSTVFTNTAVDTELGEDMDTSESEPEEDLSDEDWVQSARKWPKKRSRTSIRGSMLPELVRKPQKLNLDILKDSPDGELEKNNTPCCSCTKNSSCKTKKCECRDRGGLCGPSCGCVAAKCSNRVAEPLTVKEEEASGAELAEHEDNEKTVVTLASEGAALLRKALDDKPPEAEHEESARKPLSDIGNTKANGTAAKPGKRKNWRKSVPKFKTVVIPDTPQNANTGSQQVKAKSDAPLPLKLPRAMTASAQNNPPLAEKNTADNKETIHIGRPSKDSEGKENERV